MTTYNSSDSQGRKLLWILINFLDSNHHRKEQNILLCSPSLYSPPARALQEQCLSTIKHSEGHTNYLLLKWPSHDRCSPLHSALCPAGSSSTDTDHRTNLSLQLNLHLLHLEIHRLSFTTGLHTHKTR